MIKVHTHAGKQGTAQRHCGIASGCCKVWPGASGHGTKDIDADASLLQGDLLEKPFTLSFFKYEIYFIYQIHLGPVHVWLCKFDSGW